MEYLLLEDVVEASHERHFPFFDIEAGLYKDYEMRGTGSLLQWCITYGVFASADWGAVGTLPACAGRPTGPVTVASRSTSSDYLITLMHSDTTWSNSHILRGHNPASRLDTLSSGMAIIPLSMGAASWSTRGAVGRDRRVAPAGLPIRRRQKPQAVRDGLPVTATNVVETRMDPEETAVEPCGPCPAVLLRDRYAAGQGAGDDA